MTGLFIFKIFFASILPRHGNDRVLGDGGTARRQSLLDVQVRVPRENLVYRKETKTCTVR